MNDREKLLEILIKNKVINAEQLASIKANLSKNEPLEKILEGLVDPEELTKAKAELRDLPYVDISEIEISEGVLNTISGDVAENYKIICFDKSKDRIKVGIVDPDNFKAIEAVDFLANEQRVDVDYYLISNKSFRAAFKQYKTLTKELTSALRTKAEAEEELVTVPEKDKKDLEEVTKSAPVAKIVSVIIRHAVEGEASDIHIEPMKKESRVRYRIDGILHTSLILPRSIHSAIVARIKVMANLKLDESRIPQDGRIRLMINDKEIDFRISILPVIGGEKVVMRILDTSKGAPTLEDLGFQGQQLKVLMNNLQKTEGIMLVTGPTGSGKSTTLFALLSLLNKEGVNIATLEDPIEYQLKGANQSQIFPELGYDFASGLRSFLRQDPDIIMVGEIRDSETAELSIHAALTGHLVLSTLHTTDAAGSVTRLVDMDIEAFLLGSTLNTIVAQRLCGKICKYCKEEVRVPDIYIEDFKKNIESIPADYIKNFIPNFDPQNIVVFKGKGCSRCNNTGYTGRVAINEVLDVNDQIKEIILKGKKYLDLEEVKKTQNFITIKQDGILKVLQGLTSIEEVLRVMRD